MNTIATILVSMYLPAVPVLLTVNCEPVRNECTGARAFLTTPNAGGEPGQTEIPATMTVNPSATYAVVQFEDGSSIDFDAIPGRHEQSVEVAHDPWSMNKITRNDAYASGTLLGFTFDTRETESECPSCVQIMSIVLRFR